MNLKPRKYQDRTKYDAYGNRYSKKHPKSKGLIIARRKLKTGETP
jgi:hypothetical protein